MQFGQPVQAGRCVPYPLVGKPHRVLRTVAKPWGAVRQPEGEAVGTGPGRGWQAHHRVDGDLLSGSPAAWVEPRQPDVELAVRSRNDRVHGTRIEGSGPTFVAEAEAQANTLSGSAGRGQIGIAQHEPVAQAAIHLGTTTLAGPAGYDTSM